MTHAGDPTTEPRGFTRMKPKTRHLRRHTQHTYNGNKTVALSECIVTKADGTQYSLKKTRDNKVRATHVAPATTVRIRKRMLRAPITDYIAVAQRVGLDPLAVATEYRYRRDNGYITESTIPIEFNSTFRGE